MHAAGLGEPGLRGAQGVGQAAQHRLPNYQFAGNAPVAGARGHRFDGSLATDAAARGGVEIARHPREIQRQIGAHRDSQDIAGGPAEAGIDDVARFAQQSFAVQEADREFRVVARRTHGDGDGAAGAAVLVRLGQAVAHEPDLERLFDRDDIAAARISRIAQRVDLHVAMGQDFSCGRFTPAQAIRL